MNLWDRFLELVSQTKLSDLHVRAGDLLSYREHGDIHKTDQVVTEDDLLAFLREVLEPEEFAKFLDSKTVHLENLTLSDFLNNMFELKILDL